ncbi:unnamed protein product [Nesidiocoris tenuis]|uniref:Secreted protein n=1 Tax=Nesidiocoris tenuis TaxID=355587 RepID=A0A6H5H8Z6_9HEMI|nr:unnamed protein product [Nesidiocoris tenuis]CAB0013083.1 unnamed protein product [Nesidiocoris tenuis]
MVLCCVVWWIRFGLCVCRPGNATSQDSIGSMKFFILTKKVSCCGNILWFEKCNTSEYAAGGHRPTRSDAAKHYAIRKSQSKVLLFGILQCFRQLQVCTSLHTVWRRRVKILILSPPIGDHWRGSNSRSFAVMAWCRRYTSRLLDRTSRLGEG